MALIHCPDCNRQVSDMAPACPQCGRSLHDVSPAARRVLERREFHPGYWDEVDKLHREHVQDRRRKTWIAGVATLIVGFVLFPLVSAFFESWEWGRNALGWLFVLGVVVWITCLIQQRQLKKDEEYHAQWRRL